MNAERLRIDVPHPRCPYCHDEIPKGEKPEVCPDCHALHHQDCWAELKACAACGARPASAPERPVVRVRPTGGQDYTPLCEWQDCARPAVKLGLCERHASVALLVTVGVLLVAMIVVVVLGLAGVIPL